MKTLSILLLALTAVPSVAKVQPYFSNRSALEHVLQSKELVKLLKDNDKSLKGTELVRTEIDRKGKDLAAKYTVLLQFVNIEGGVMTNCTTRASVHIEIYTIKPPGPPRPPITGSRLTAPRFSVLQCAE